MARIASKDIRRLSAQPIWQAVVFPVLVLIVIALSVMATTFGGSLLDPDSHWPHWVIVLFLWVVSAPLALVAGLLVGRAVRYGVWNPRLWKVGLIWVAVFVLATGALSVFFALVPSGAMQLSGESTTGAILGIASYLSAWGVGVPLGSFLGLWLAYRRARGIVEQAHRAGHGGLGSR